jgi:hypothetical protein
VRRLFVGMQRHLYDVGTKAEPDAQLRAP